MKHKTLFMASMAIRHTTFCFQEKLLKEFLMKQKKVIVAYGLYWKSKRLKKITKIKIKIPKSLWRMNKKKKHQVFCKSTMKWNKIKTKSKLKISTNVFIKLRIIDSSVFVEIHFTRVKTTHLIKGTIWEPVAQNKKSLKSYLASTVKWLI